MQDQRKHNTLFNCFLHIYIYHNLLFVYTSSTYCIVYIVKDMEALNKKNVQTDIYENKYAQCTYKNTHALRQFF